MYDPQSCSVLYDGQFSFLTIYNVSKCMMLSVLKICSDFESPVVYSTLNKQYNPAVCVEKASTDSQSYISQEGIGHKTKKH